MIESIPWKAPAVIALKCKGDLEYRPEIAGLTLNSALEYVADTDLPISTKLCILVDWQGEEVTIEGRRIWKLITDPNRPSLSVK